MISDKTADRFQFDKKFLFSTDCFAFDCASSRVTQTSEAFVYTIRYAKMALFHMNVLNLKRSHTCSTAAYCETSGNGTTYKALGWLC